MADKTLNVRLQNAINTDANWKSADPVLKKGEIAISSDKSYKYKVGDGTSKWSQLSYNSFSKADVGLSNVENKSSATIRGEITKDNVTTALGYTPNTPTEVDNKITNGTVSHAATADSATALSSSAGSGSQPIFFKDGKPSVTTYALNKTVPADAVFTDAKVTNTLNTSTQAFITGTTTSTTNTGGQIFDTGVFLTTTPGQLHAVSYKVNNTFTISHNSTTGCLEISS